MVSLRALKWLVAVMGVMIVAGTVTLGVLIVQRLGGGLGAMSGGGEAPAPVSLGQPVGTRIEGIAAMGGGDRLAIRVVRPDGEARIVVFDPRRGRVAGEIRP
jgi:hypothetical protein